MAYSKLTEYSKEYNKRYKREHYKTVCIKVSLENRKLIEHLESKGNKTKYIVSLIERDMEGSV
jgi:hypothetical protein